MSSISAQTGVVIANLKRDIDKEALAALCSQLGRVVSFGLHTSGHDPDSTATAVVGYTSKHEAARVVSSVNGRLILGQPVTACLATPGEQYHQPASEASLPLAATGSTQPPANPQPTTRLARATYPDGMQHQDMNPSDRDKNGGPPSAYARYPPVERISSNEEQPRSSQPGTAALPTWERSVSGQEDRRVAGERLPPQPSGAMRYGEAYAVSDHQAWAGGRPRRDSGGSAAAAQGARYAGGRDDAYAMQQWEDQDEGVAEDEGWDERAPYVAPEAPRTDLSAYRRQGSSGWTDEPGHQRPPAGYVGGGGGQRRMVRRDLPMGPGAGRPRERGDDYADEETGDIVGSKRRLPPPPGSGHGVPAADGRPAWNENARYSEHPRPAAAAAAAVPTPSREDFEKEVMRQAALLVAERELRVRQESRQQVNDKKEWLDEPAPHRREHREREGRERTNNAGAHSMTMNRRHTLSVEDTDNGRLGRDSRERRQQDAHGDRGRTADREKNWQRDVAAGDGWRDNKKARRDNSAPRSARVRTDERAGSARASNVRMDARTNERAGTGRTDNVRTDIRADDRHAIRMKHDVRRDGDDARASKVAARDGSRGMNRDVDRDRRREDDSRKQKEENRPRRDSRGFVISSIPPRERDTFAVSHKPSNWEATKRANNAAEDERRAKRATADKVTATKAAATKAAATKAAASKDATAGASLSKSWENSTADTGFYVHVGGLSFSTTFTTLAKRFAAFGDVNGFKVIFNKVSCRSQPTDGAGSGKRKEEAIKPAVVTASTGFAFISFDNEDGMEKAIAGMDNQVLDGHLLKVSRGRIPMKASSHQRNHSDFAALSRQRGGGVGGGVGGGGMKTARRWPPPKGKHGSTAAQAHAPHQNDNKGTGKHDNGSRQDKADVGTGDRDRPAPVSPAALAAAASVVAAAAAASSSSSSLNTKLKSPRADGDAKAARERTTSMTDATATGPAPPPAAADPSPTSVGMAPPRFGGVYGETNGGGKANSPLLRGIARRTKKNSGAKAAAAAAAAAAAVTGTATANAGGKVSPATSGKGGGGAGGGGRTAAGDRATAASMAETTWAGRRSSRVSAALAAVMKKNEKKA